MDPQGPIRAQLIFDPKTLERYFEHAASARACLEPLIQSLDGVNRLGEELSWEDLRAGGPTHARELQYYKDERFLTLYGFGALDLLGDPARRTERCEHLDQLMERALGGDWPGFDDPRLWFEKQIPAPRGFRDHLAGPGGSADAHPVTYVRASASRRRRLEGPTHTDALIEDGDRVVVFEAKFVSDISTHTTHAVARNQIARNVEAGLEYVKGDVSRLYFVFVSPRAFQREPWTRLYGYKLPEYMSDPGSIRRDLPHLGADVDFATLAQHVGWVTWEDICEILWASPSFSDPEGRLQQFFEERRLWPAGASRGPDGGNECPTR
ncbi:MAG: hypothetical protein V3V67_04590 [Myxococcota bacterium]